MLNATHAMATAKGAPASWAAAVLHDLAWLAHHAAPKEAPPPATHPEWWTAKARWDSKTWAKWCKHAKLGHKAHYLDEIRLRQLRDDMQSLGAPPPPPALHPARRPQYICLERGSHQATRRALRTHIGKRHIDCDKAGRWARGSVCGGCAKQFYNRIRLVRHLRRQPACLDHAVADYVPLSDDEL